MIYLFEKQISSIAPICLLFRFLLYTVNINFIYNELNIKYELKYFSLKSKKLTYQGEKKKSSTHLELILTF